MVQHSESAKGSPPHYALCCRASCCSDATHPRNPRTHTTYTRPCNLSILAAWRHVLDDHAGTGRVLDAPLPTASPNHAHLNEGRQQRRNGRVQTHGLHDSNYNTRFTIRIVWGVAAVYCTKDKESRPNGDAWPVSFPFAPPCRQHAPETHVLMVLRHSVTTYTG